MKIESIHIKNLLNYAECLSLNESELITTDDIDLNNCDELIDAHTFLKIFGNIQQKVTHDYFGLYYGCFLNIKSLGFIAEISLNSNSIEQAIFILNEYLKNSFPLVILTVIKKNNALELLLDSPIKDSLLKNNLLDTVICFVYRELKLMLDKKHQPTVNIPYENCEEYSRFLLTEVKIGNSHSLIFRKDVITAEINRDTPKHIEMLLPKFLTMLENFRSTKKLNFSDKVKAIALNMCCPEPPNFEQVSSHFPLSKRTFQRKLTLEGTSFREITDTIKRELATYLIKGNAMQTKEISYLLGYSESSTFLRAFRRWKETV